MYRIHLKKKKIKVQNAEKKKEGKERKGKVNVCNKCTKCCCRLCHSHNEKRKNTQFEFVSFTTVHVELVLFPINQFYVSLHIIY